MGSASFLTTPGVSGVHGPGPPLRYLRNTALSPRSAWEPQMLPFGEAEEMNKQFLPARVPKPEANILWVSSNETSYPQ